jgi:type I restriction enzyme S subunit
MSSETKASVAREEAKPGLVPKLRFPEFQEMPGWAIEEVGDLLDESRTVRAERKLTPF